MRRGRSKLAGVLAALALVAVSAIGLRLSDPEDTFDMVTGVTGQPVTSNTGELTVTGVRVGTVLIEYHEVRDRTAGMFVAVAVTGAATGPKQVNLAAAELISKDVRYNSYRLTPVTAPPGFQTSTDIVFEVDPAQIDGLTLQMRQNEILSGYQQRIRVPLGINAANAAQWRTAARDHAIEVAPNVTGAIP